MSFLGKGSYLSFGIVSGMFRECYSFYKPNFRLEISRNHAPGFLISKDTKKLRETSDNICRIAKICRHFFSDFLYFSPKFSVFPRYSPNFSAFLRNSLRISFFLRIFAPENPLPRKGCGVIIFKKVLKNDAALPSEIDSRAFYRFLVTEILRFQIIFVTLRQKLKH